MKKILLSIFLLFFVLPLLFFLFNQFELKAPEVSVNIPSKYLPRTYNMHLNIAEKGTGLRRVFISISQNSKDKVLLDKTYPRASYVGLFFGSGVYSDSLDIAVESSKYGMGDGEATLSVKVFDYSWWSWNNGNSFSVEQQVMIDTKPPEIEVLTKSHNVNKGGVGLVIYRIKDGEDIMQTGVEVGDVFYKGYVGMFEQKNIFSTFFALTHLQGAGTEISVKAEDVAGNVSKKGFYYYIKDKKFRSDILEISDSFLQNIMPQFNLGEVELTFDATDNPLLSKFIYINQKLRVMNIEQILKPVDQTENKMMWSGPFLRLPAAAPRAQFADHRTYKYGGKQIDQQYHMGVDLASLARADIPAANAGRVIGVDDIGIFGKCVLIDHGFGLCSSYAHLSNISVKVGDMVKKGDIIGQTGLTGLAVGDHLHFGMSVDKTFVNPVEWWDSLWIKNNIELKINEVKQEINKK
ncbi:MAG: M23 family metallopeptidase [Desulfamplus sp.]|nr:M23 family metallopeptidase [Desulfamplus sp.]MBF0243393.1 M23 family metallopeptidase [Desulfamplus sp.]